jgi:decaprenylphospho-beta-D-ribofuranose 2-oxidase
VSLGVWPQVTTSLRPEYTRGSLATPDQLPPKLRRHPLRFNAPQLFTVADIFPNQ